MFPRTRLLFSSFFFVFFFFSILNASLMLMDDEEKHRQVLSAFKRQISHPYAVGFVAVLHRVCRLSYCPIDTTRPKDACYEYGVGVHLQLFPEAVHLRSVLSQ